MVFGEVPQVDLQKHQLDKKDRSVLSANEKIDAAFEDNILSLTEINAITEMYKKASSAEEAKEIKDHIDELLKKDTVYNIGRLKQEIENMEPHFGYNDLINSFNDNFIREIYKGFGDSIDENLGVDFSIKEKDNIKFVFTDMLNDFLKDSDLNNLTKEDIKILENELLSIKNIEEAKDKKFEIIKNLLDKLSKSKSPGLQKLAKTFEKMLKMVEKLEIIKKEKKEKKTDFSDIHKVYEVLGIKGNEGKTQKEIFTEAKDKMGELFKNLEDLDPKKVTELAKEKGVSKDSDKNDKISFLEKMFPGNDFFSQLMKLFFAIALRIDNNGKLPGTGKKAESIKSLSEAVKNNKDLLNGKVTIEQLKKLDPKKLEDFYKLLDSNNISYNTKEFWEQLLTGKGLKKGDKLLKLHQSLVGKDGKILSSTEDLDDLITKLNNLKLTTTEKSKKSKKEKQD